MPNTPEELEDIHQPPRADVPANARIKREQEATAPGSQRAQEIARQDAQQSRGKSFVDGVGITTASRTGQMLEDEAPGLMGVEDPADMWGITNAPSRVAAAVMSIAGYRKGEKDYDKDAEYDALTKGIPYEFHSEILENDNLEAAHRSRARIQDVLERGERISQQRSGTLSVLAGSLLDVDLPLIAMSGGAWQSAKAAGVGLRTARKLNMSPNAALRVGGLTQGVNAGVQAGALVGGVGMAVDETQGWQDLVQMTFASAILGGGIGTALKGDITSSLQAAQKEFHASVARDAPELRSELDIEQMSTGQDNILTYAQRPNEQSTVGAANISPVSVPGPSAKMVDPNGSISSTSGEWIDNAHAWRKDSGWLDAKVSADSEFWARVAMSAAGSFSTNNFAKLYNSDSAMANYMAGNIFESASGLGRGRVTASIQNEMYHKRIQTHLGTEIDTALRDFAKETGQTWKDSGYGNSSAARQDFNRQVMLEMNDRARGRDTTGKRSPHVQRAADQYEKAGQEGLNIGRGRDGETPMDGFDGIPDRRGYSPQIWNGRNLLDLEKRGVVTRDMLVEGLADGYSAAGMATGKDAKAVAKAVLQRAVARDGDVDTSMMSLLSGDGKQWLEESLILSGMSRADTDATMARLIGRQHNRAKESFAKTRNDIDWDQSISTLDGSELRIVDLLDQDMHTNWQRYSRRLAGSAALARQGITNRVKRDEFITALQAEQRALGEEPMDAGLLHAMFSHFNGGPTHGYSRGMLNEGVGPEIATIKRMTNLALLGKLGLTQLMETGVTIAQNGLQNWAARGPMALLDKELRAANKVLLDDMAHFTGRIGEDHHHFATWSNLDDVGSREITDWLKGVVDFSTNASYIQGFTSLFNHVRSFQQTTAALGMADKVMRTLKQSIDSGEALDAGTLARFESDFGLMPQDVNMLEQLINNGTIEFRTTKMGNTYVNRLNMDRWGDTDLEIGEVFGSAITRNVNQLVQKSMAGEQDAWMHTQWGSIITHLKTFPMQAFHKQFVRNMRHMDTQNLATFMYAMATAAVMMQVRDVADGRQQRSPSDLAKSAFSYSNMTGFIPMVYDPAMTILGLNDARINQFGPYADLTPPSVKIANNLRRAPGALWNAANGEMNWHDRQALKALPFANTIGFARAF